MRSILVALFGLLLVAPMAAYAQPDCAAIQVYVGDTTGDAGEIIYVPVKTDDTLIDFYVEAFQFDLHYCYDNGTTGHLTYVGYSTVGTMIDDYGDPTVYEYPMGNVNVAWAGTADLVGPGVFVYLMFEVSGDVLCWDYCVLWVTDFLINEMELCPEYPPWPGFWHAGPLTELEICVYSWNEMRPVPGAHIRVWTDYDECDYYDHLEHTDITGCTEFMVCSGCYYCFDVWMEDYTCDDNDVDNAITALDAALILMHVVGNYEHELLPFNCWQEIAADVSQNGEIRAYDAACILKWILWCDGGDIEVPEDCFVGVWEFFCGGNCYDPVECCFPVNFAPVSSYSTAVLLGDPSGNWGEPHPPRTEIPVNVNAPVVRGQQHPEVPIVVPVNGYTELVVYAGTMSFGFNDDQVRLLDVEPVGLPAAMWMWTETGNRVTVTFAGIEGVVPDGCMLNLIFAWRSGEGTVPVEILDVAFNEDHLTTTVHDGAVMFPSNPRELVGPRPGFALFASPNPVQRQSTTTISFSLDSTQDVDLAIYDVSGRMVRNLASGAFAAGVHDVTWDGRNDGGAPLGAGVYFARLRAGDAQHMQRIMMLR